MKKSRKAGKIIRSIIFVIALCVFIYSAVQLVIIYMGYKQGEDTYKDIEDMFVQKNTENTDKNESTDENTKTEKEEEEKVFVWDYEKMYKYNEDTLGYIRNGDVISYPILQTDNNDYYLTHLVSGDYNSSGAIFVDAGIKEGLEADNAIIYGHNMKNGSMFGTLKYYKQEAYAKKYQDIHIYTDKNEYIYKVFATYTTAPDSNIYVFGFLNGEKFVEYLNECREFSTSDLMPEYKFSENDKIITLSTCTNDGKERFVVQAVRVETVKE